MMYESAKVRVCLLAALLPAALSNPVAAAASSPPSSSASYDYVIIGGGTAGLVLANRLTEDPKVSVAVIEPGGDTRNNANVTSPSGFPSALGTSIDWHYPMLPQTYGGASRQLNYSAGKALGGTTTINGMTYVRAQIAQIDAWEQIGNKGWNWANLWPYYLKQEVFQPPTPAQVDAGAAYVPKYHGTKGPVKVGWEYGLFNGTMHTVQNETWKNLGYVYNPDVNGGDENGFTVWPRMVNRANNTRCDAAQAYLWPYHRSNLHIIQGFANKIVWSSIGQGNATASGVQYTASGGQVVIAGVKKEVIVSAGSMKSPAILELSGVGNPAILSRYGIKTVVNSTGVGEHLQDQPNISVFDASTNATADGIMPYVTFATMNDIYGYNTSAVASSAKSAIPAWARRASRASNGSVSAAAYEKIFNQQWDLLFNRNIPAAELLNSKFPGNLLTAFWTLIPFSRGSVHIGSADPAVVPRIDYDYFTVDFDLKMQTELAKISRKFYATQPVKTIVQGENAPGLKTVPLNGSDAQWHKWIQQNFGPNHHALGTNSMLPRELGGVVDERLKVYGTSNVRVVDASVFPSQVSGHLTATVYAIAERAADIIKNVI